MSRVKLLVSLSFESLLFYSSDGYFFQFFILYSHMQNATTPGNISLIKVDIFNSFQQEIVFFYFSFFIPVQFQRKTAPVFEQAKTSGCTLANHVISERIYPNKAWSNTIPLWLPNGFCIIHLDPYNNTGSLGAIFRFPRFPCRDTTLSG